MAQQQLSPAMYTPQSHQPHSATPGSANPYSGFGGGYSVLGMGLPAVGFPYNGQMAANFAQVSVLAGCILWLLLAVVRPLYVLDAICVAVR